MWEITAFCFIPDQCIRIYCLFNRFGITGERKSLCQRLRRNFMRLSVEGWVLKRLFIHPEISPEERAWG